MNATSCGASRMPGGYRPSAEASRHPEGLRRALPHGRAGAHPDHPCRRQGGQVRCERPRRSEPHQLRDRFIRRKGHGPSAYHAVLAAKGFFPEDVLAGFLEWGNPLGSHPDRNQVPGVEASTGSLGHGLALAVGSALALRAKGTTDERVVVLCGDAELNEGSNWESILLAPHLNLTNLTLLVIDNHSSSIPMGPWQPRLGSFGWGVVVVGGHDKEQLYDARALRCPGRHS